MTNSTAAEDSFQASHLGARLRAARLDRGQTVRGLARTIGCSASLLSQIELGKTAPSVGILYSLATALDVSTDDLLQTDTGQGAVGTAAPNPAPAEPSSASPVARFQSLRDLPPSAQAQVQRHEHRRAIDFDHGVRWERLTTTSETSTDFLEIIYAPGARSDHDDHTVGHEGFEYGVVVAGELTTLIGAEEFVLRTGDSITFDASTPHVYRNDGDVPARAIWVVLHGADHDLR